MDTPLICQDGIRELITIGIGRSAGIINRLTNAHVHIIVPDVYIVKTVIECPSFSSSTENASLVFMKFSGILTGLVNLIIQSDSAVNMVDLISGEQVNSAEMDAVRIDTLMEAGNIIISCTMSALCSVIPSHPDYHLPAYRNDRRDIIISDLCPPEYSVTILIKIRFGIQEKIIEGELILLLTSDSFERLKDMILKMAGDGDESGI